MRDRHCTVAQLRVILDVLLDNDVICTYLPPSGNLPIIRNGKQYAVVEMAPQDLGLPFDLPFASLMIL